MGKSFGRPKYARDLKRKSRGIREFTRILITCEGSRTEPNYFRGLCKSLGLTSAVVEVTGKECGSSPISVCDYAIARLASDRAFEHVYCVFDRDTHETFDAAVRKITEHPSKILTSIVSFPCFEYWILLHFRFTRATARRAGSKSAGDQMIDLVLVEWPEYSKGSANVYERLNSRGLTDTAIANARQARADVSVTGNPDPSTDIDILVLTLRKLAKESQALCL